MTEPLWQGRKVLVSVGTGGVGKTTVSASLAVAAAAAGKRTLVMTIDPARRLANALGLTDFGDVEREIPKEALAPYGVQLKAPLWAMMPDVKRTFDDLIARIAPTPERRRQILENRIYKQFSTVIAGSLEYAAVEKLYEVHSSGRYDLIVLDTPPSQSAFDFLHAPGRIIDFLEQETIQRFVRPYAAAGRLSWKLLDLGTSFIVKTLGRFAGGEVLQELADFLLSFQGLYDGFRDRARKVRGLIASEELAFVLVATARGPERAAMLRFREDLASFGVTVRALVLNRVRQLPFDEAAAAAVQKKLAERVPKQHAAAWADALGEEAKLAHLDAEALRRLREELPALRTIPLYELPLDAHDLESLARLSAAFRET